MQQEQLHGEHLKGLVISNMMMDVPAYNAYAHDVLMRDIDPARRGIDHINPAVYVKMQGPSELGISDSATLAACSHFEDVRRIDVPTLVIGATHDTMDPAHMEEVARRLPRGTYLHCPQGSHMAMYDDQQTYVQVLISWLRGLK